MYFRACLRQVREPTSKAPYLLVPREWATAPLEVSTGGGEAPAVAAGFSEAVKKSEVGQEGAILANDGEAIKQTSCQTLFRPARVLHLFAGKSRGGAL